MKKTDIKIIPSDGSELFYKFNQKARIIFATPRKDALTDFRGTEVSFQEVQNILNISEVTKEDAADYDVIWAHDDDFVAAVPVYRLDYACDNKENSRITLSRLDNSLGYERVKREVLPEELI